MPAAAAATGPAVSPGRALNPPGIRPESAHPRGADAHRAPVGGVGPALDPPAPLQPPEDARHGGRMGVVDGASALAAFDARPPKLVVLDVNLPDVNGFEVCRAMQAKSDVPILFLSARGSDDDQILALGLGVTMTCASPSPWRCCWPRFAAAGPKIYR